MSAGMTNCRPEETAIEEGAIAMSAEMHRPIGGPSTRPQVGRFYGDFLCMASFRKNGGPLALMRRHRRFSFQVKMLAPASYAGGTLQQLDITGEFRG